MWTLAVAVDQIQKYWSPLWNTKLREDLLLGGLVNKEYDGKIAAKGDTITVSLLGEIEGEIKSTSDPDYNVFSDETPTPEKVALVADRIASGAVQVETIAELQSLIERGVMGERITRAIMKRINTYLYSLFAPSASAPDHQLSKSSIAAAELAEVRRLFSESYVGGTIYGLISPQYWEGMLTAAGLSSADYVEDSPVINGQKARKLMGMQLYEDNSRTGKLANFFHPDAILYASQTSIETKLSDLHAMKQRGYLLSSEIIFGAKAGLQASLKCVQVTG